MKNLSFKALIGILCLLAFQQYSSAQNKPNRNLELESAAAKRSNEFLKFLKPSAAKKLAIVSETIVKKIAKGDMPSNLEETLRVEIKKHFNRLSTAQLDVLSFIALESVGRCITSGGRTAGGANAADVDAIVDAMKNDLDSMSEMGETESLRLQMAMDRMSKMMSTLSNLLKKISDTANSITQNLK